MFRRVGHHDKISSNISLRAEILRQPHTAHLVPAEVKLMISEMREYEGRIRYITVNSVFVEIMRSTIQ